MFSLVTQIEDLVCKDTESSNCLFVLLSNELNTSLKINNIQTKAKNELFQFVATKESPKALKTQIRTLQKRLILILDCFYSVNLRCQHHKNCKLIFHERLVDMVFNLLVFLERQFSRYFDGKAIAPHIYASRKKQVISEHIKKVIDSTRHITNFNLVLKPFTGFLSNEYSTHNFNEIKYFQSLLQKMVQVINAANESTVNVYSLISLLITYNHNSSSAYAFIVDYIKDSSLSHHERSKEIDVLISFKKNIAQIIENKLFKYTDKHDSLKQNILNWLNNEITHFKEHGNTQAIHIEPDQKLPKIETNFTVGQMACFIRQLTEVTLIDKKYMPDLLELFSKSFTSKKSSNISKKSLYNNCNDPDERSKRITKELFQKLYQSI
ncbi:hypothetical protein [Saccharicrinis aurantiacus]|uniref:hypothetical protein n=1 Tax=Saccharicrinis aurantiacus TaxID=1849719 RepID=UPI00095034B3|nr:hypothetical protein [Saccharicrinis aurantiacus]